MNCNLTAKLPAWFKQELPDEKSLRMIRLLSEFGIKSVCQEARCPNLSSCFRNGKAAFLILGSICTRDCSFCAVNKAKNTGILDEAEPERIRDLVRILGLNYVVITSVTRDDLPDAGANIFARSIELIHSLNGNIIVEVLIPDFQGKISSLKCVLDASPGVLAHNIETVNRLYPFLRPQANYLLSLTVLSKAKELRPDIDTKSSIMLGLGETEAEIIKTMQDLRANQCDILTLGQYLAPSIRHYPVKKFIGIEDFQRYQEIGRELGFKAIFSGPLVRSSYCAEQVYRSMAHA
ncbi:MAG: lipoyl synthase [Candidatus Omnitrophica bacterium]|nr:lipoyl synthase [Candidatus Omnitrophota bacterium]MDD5238456.1 lipoyl synthase [Candidatus Omnitrophota bacterium]